VDDTNLQGRLLALEKENRRLWKSHDDLMRDQTETEKAVERLDKRLKVVEAWLAAGDDLKPAAEGSTE